MDESIHGYGLAVSRMPARFVFALLSRAGHSYQLTAGGGEESGRVAGNPDISPAAGVVSAPQVRIAGNTSRTARQ